MSRYHLRPIGVRAFASHRMLQVIGSFDNNAQPSDRQQTIEYLTREHGMSLATTRSLRYDPALIRREGLNTKGHIRIGPLAFRQDRSWLANVLLHEVIHSDQFHFYAQHGVVFGHREASCEAERVMVALDEFESFYWSWRNGRMLGLSPQQTAELAREVRLWQIEIDDQEILAFARAAQFNAARLALLRRLPRHE